MKYPTNKQRILLIDDSDEDRAAVRSCLMQGAPLRRYEFREANDPVEGLKLCACDADWPIDCVIVDVHMPAMTGVELVEQLQHEDGYPRLPVIVMTGSRGVSEAEAALRAGAQDYLPKDAVLPEIMPRIVDNAISRHGMAVRLHQSEHLADLANQAKSEFIANMSHEIRTPMTAILGYAALLEEAESDRDKLEHIHTIQRNGIFLLELINDILDVSKIEAGKMEAELKRFAPHTLIGEVLDLMSVRAAEKNLQFKAVTEGPIPAEIESDPRRLKQVLVNLLGNAIKFTESGSVRLVVRFLDNDAAQMQFEVTDTGIGMTPEQQVLVFQPFSQADASVNRRFGGTGLGLTISRRLVNMLGGELTFHSTYGQGSRFCCSIHAGNHSTRMLVDPELHVGDSPQQVACGDSLQCSVLVVDDRRDVRHLVSHFLTKAGADVELAEDGEQGLEFVERALAGEEKRVDLILLDMQMPRLDGYQTAARLRKMGFDKPIIAITADAMHGDMKRCLECGCNAYLSKPIDRAKLVDAVSHFSATRHLDPN